VKKYPVMKFKSSRLTDAGSGKFTLTGNLTINAITKQVVLDLDSPTPPIKDIDVSTLIYYTPV
jgi:polyisoprenoid-binding protein YceI